MIKGEILTYIKDIKDAAAMGQDDKLRKLFSEAYSNKLSELGFQYLDTRPVKHHTTTIYYLPQNIRKVTIFG